MFVWTPFRCLSLLRGIWSPPSPRLVGPNSKNFHFVFKDIVVHVPGFSPPCEHLCKGTKFPQASPQLSSKQSGKSTNKFDVGGAVKKSNQDMDMIFLDARSEDAVMKFSSLPIHGSLNKISVFKKSASICFQNQMSGPFWRKGSLLLSGVFQRSTTFQIRLRKKRSLFHECALWTFFGLFLF